MLLTRREQLARDMSHYTASDVSTRLKTSFVGGSILTQWGKRQTPGIDYLSGSDLLTFDQRWYQEIEVITRAEKHLLTKTRQELEPATQDGRVIIAIDTTENNRVVGCIVLWELDQDDQRRMWYELGTFVVVPDHRYKARGPKAMPIGDVLYRKLLHVHRDKNILGTTTNLKAIHTGLRHGMQMIGFQELPLRVHRSTCICPIEKTGVRDNLFCQIKNQSCRMRVSFHTWIRMGYPKRLPTP
ncbi:GNAT family N-acetyltransferase [Candidatus Uhrbacteria bacterium]|nr:GNAT family N-acetyltransferase [Candidatus Uhrbacteria bacterium]